MTKPNDIIEKNNMNIKESNRNNIIKYGLLQKKRQI